LVIAGATASPWPTHLYVFAFGAEPETYQYEDIEVTATYGEFRIEPEALRPPTRRVEFRVLDLKTGRDHLFAAEATGAAILGTKATYPEIEVWSPVSARRFARCVFRKVGRGYCCSVEETFESSGAGPAAAELIWEPATGIFASWDREPKTAVTRPEPAPAGVPRGFRLRGEAQMSWSTPPRGPGGL